MSLIAAYAQAKAQASVGQAPGGFLIFFGCFMAVATFLLLYFSKYDFGLRKSGGGIFVPFIWIAISVGVGLFAYAFVLFSQYVTRKEVNGVQQALTGMGNAQRMKIQASLTPQPRSNGSGFFGGITESIGKTLGKRLGNSFMKSMTNKGHQKY